MINNQTDCSVTVSSYLFFVMLLLYVKKTFFYSFASAAWITLLSGGSSWSIKATVDLSPRTDTGRINTSPTVDIPPLIFLESGCNYKLDLLGILS